MTRPIQVFNLGRRDYHKCWDLQKAILAVKRRSAFPDTLLLVEHPPVYTIGRRGGAQHLLAPRSFLEQQGIPVYEIERGGDITFHGPGQLVGYPIMDLKNFRPDVNFYLRQLEEVLIRTMRAYGLAAGRQAGLTGVWVDDAKVAAIGISAHGWITMHGFALNVTTDLSHFDRIIPCGIRGMRVASMSQWLGNSIDWETVAETLVDRFGDVFDARMIKRPSAELESALAFSRSPAAPGAPVSHRSSFA